MEGGGAARHILPSRVEEPQEERQVALLPAPPGYQNHETYIVQMPRDQVYRVPPPENAHIVESYRNPSDGKKKKKNSSRICCGCCCKVILALLAILVLLAVTLTILFFVFKPTPPKFSVTNLVVKNHEGVKNSTARPQYEISLTAENPNKRYRLEYENGAQVSLLFDDKKVGAAKSFPTLLQQPGDSSKVKVEVAGSHEALPVQMEKSMNSNKTDIPISLNLDIMNLPVKVNSWAFKSHVACKFRVNTLGSHNIRVLSQECNSIFR